MSNLKKNLKKLFGLIIVVIALIIAVSLIHTNKKTKETAKELDAETRRAMIYREVTDADANTNCEYVKFNAFFTRDLDGDGYAEKYDGTCNAINNRATLYFDINVLTDGKLKNGKITINGNNFKLNTALVKDEVIKSDYIGVNSVIEFKEIMHGTQKLFSGYITSNIKNNINDYSKNSNKVILTGTWESTDGKKTEEIRKEIDLTVDWHGITTTVSYPEVETMHDVSTILGTDSVNLSFDVGYNETAKQLLLQKQVTEITIPDFNGFEPLEVVVKTQNCVSSYDVNTRLLKIERNAITDASGNITKSVARTNIYSINVKYPLEAYETTEGDTVNITFPTTGYYYGYNNTSSEFNAENPYMSVATKSWTHTWNYSPSEGEFYRPRFSMAVGNYTYNPDEYSYKYLVSKRPITNMYNGILDREVDEYWVQWKVFSGNLFPEQNGLQLVEAEPDKFVGNYNESMGEYTTVKAIYFTESMSALGKEGWIKVYDKYTDDLLVEFDRTTWPLYTSVSPYYFNEKVKGIRVETSKANENTYFYVYQLKEIDDEKVVENIGRDNYEKIDYIYSYLTYKQVDGDGAELVNNTDQYYAYYEMPKSLLKFEVEPSVITNQETKTISLKLETLNSNYNESAWKNGKFLIELPEEILDVEVNNITFDNDDVYVSAYEIFENNGKQYLRIYTRNDTETTYILTASLNVTADSRKPTKNGRVKVYAENEICKNYATTSRTEDTLDINGNENTTEYVLSKNANLQIVAPSSLITAQTLSNFDNEGSVVVSPQVAIIDKSGTEKDAKINVTITNNYSGTISEAIIIGKIPFEGNTYQLNGRELGSNFSVQMKNTGISLPTSVNSIAKVYYSENLTVTKNLKNSSNNWKIAEQVTDWAKVKTYAIDLSEYVLQREEKLTFTYDVILPSSVKYNDISYSTHAVYFCLDTEDGKLRTQTEVNKLGIMVAKKYDLKVTKYKKTKNKLVAGATYKVTDGTTVKTGVTNSNGTLIIKDLKADKEYTLQELLSSPEYVLNTDEIKFKIIVNASGNAEIEYINGNTRNVPILTKENDTDILNINVEDVSKYDFKIHKTAEDTGLPLRYVRFRITGGNFGDDGETYLTDASGNLVIQNLVLGEQYKLIETKSKQGYYANNIERTFTVRRKADNTLEIVTSDPELSRANIVENNDDDKGIVNIDLTNERVPVYGLTINKIIDEDVPLENAKFLLVSADDENALTYRTDSNGKIEVENLYAFVEGKNITGSYVLKEVEAPAGYVNESEVIRFKVIKNVDSSLTVVIENEDNLKTLVSANIENERLVLTIKNEPLFKLEKIDKDTGEPLANIDFTITEMNGYPARDVNDNIIGKLVDGQYIVTTDANGIIRLPLKSGLYVCKEMNTPEQYVEADPEVFLVGSLEEETTVKDMRINYIEDLVEFSDLTNDGNNFAGNTVTLERTLDFNNPTSYKSGVVDTSLTTGKGFKPIGTFAGTFNGQENEIQNLYINDSSLYNAALFSQIDGGKIKNVGVTGNVTGGASAAGLVADLSNAMMSSCYNMCTVNSTERAGGVVSRLYDSTMKNCYNTGNITGTTYAGGLAGHIINSTIDIGYNTGNITSTNNSSSDSKAGGIAGSSPHQGYINDIEISNVYNKGTILARSGSGKSYAGGLIGEIGDTRISYGYNTGTVTSTNTGSAVSYGGGITGYGSQAVNISFSYNWGNINVNSSRGTVYAGGIIGYSYYCTYTRVYNIGNVLTTSSGTRNAGAFSGYHDSVATQYSSGTYYLDSITTTGTTIDDFGTEKTETYMKSSQFYSDLSSSRFTNIANEYPSLKDKIYEEETEVSAFEINYIEDLVSLATKVNGGNDVPEVKLMRTIDFMDPDSYRSGVVNTSLITGSGFLPIGKSSTTTFKGKFDGQGYEIRNLYINSDLGDVGLFGCVSGGSIENLGVTGVVIANHSSGSTGGIVGELDSYSKINCCYANVDVNATVSVYASSIAYAGGIAGDTRNSTISNCYNLGTITQVGTMTRVSTSSYLFIDTGGIVGYITDSTVKNCYNTGNVYGSSDTNHATSGGIKGNSETVTNSYILDSCEVTGNTILSAAKVTDEYMRSPEFCEQLNTDNVWMHMNNEYPRLYGFTSDLQSLTELKIENETKEFKITTAVKVTNGIKGGSISGEGARPYETVKFGKSNNNIILMTPNTDYEISEITVNGEEYEFVAEENGSFTMPQFTDIRENKHIVVKYVKKDQKFIVNKVDKDTREPLKGVKFSLQQIEDRSIPVDSIGDFVDNGKESLSKALPSSVVGELKNNGSTYVFVEQSGTYVPTNGLLYQKANGGTSGIPNSAAYSYMEIDLTGYTGNYIVVVNATAASESSRDFGMASITTTSTTPANDDDTGKFMKISGRISSTNYISAVIEGGRKYYLHLAYTKDNIADGNDDRVVINTVNVYESDAYSFENQGGVYKSTNKGVASSVCYSYVPVDLRGCKGKYDIVVNAKVSSETSDYGFGIVRETTDAPSQYLVTGRFMKISGTSSSVTTPTDYVTTLNGGKLYYLHFGYAKDSSINSGEDIFTINSIKIELNSDDFYAEELMTNSKGQIVEQLKSGTYELKELEALEGYELDDTVRTIIFDETDSYEITVENKSLSQVVVHHYLKKKDGTYTTTKLAEDEMLFGSVGDYYTTSPKIDLEGYQLEKVSGVYVIPGNASGTYIDGKIEVIYYYEENLLNLTVHHYLQGTEDKLVEDEEKLLNKLDFYETSAKEELLTKYDVVTELTTVEPETAETTGNITEDTIVTYYYKLKEHNITTKVHPITVRRYDEISMETKEVTLKGGDISGENERPYEVVYHEEDSTKEIKANPDEEYKIKKITINGEEIGFVANTDNTYTLDNFENVTEDKEIEVEFEPVQGTVNVYYYIEGTTTPVKLVDGADAQSITKTNYVGERYVTTELENVASKYELVEIPDNASGQYIDDTINVFYYYRLKPAKVIVHHYIEGTTTPVPLRDGTNSDDITITGLVDDRYITTPIETSEKYEVVNATPAKASGEMTEEDIEVTYYYALKNAKVIVHYYVEGTKIKVPLAAGGEAQDVIITGKVDDEYNTEAAENVASKYELIGTPVNSEGTMTVDDTIVIYYYRLKETGVLVHYYIEGTKTKVPLEGGGEAQDVLIEGRIDDTYRTEKASNVSNKYELVDETPDKWTGTMTEDQIVVEYYYRLKDTSVLVHHYIEGTEIKVPLSDGSTAEDETLTGKVDDDYHTEYLRGISNKYEVVDTNPEGATGKMTVDQIVVTYYYKLKDTSVLVHHYIEGTTVPVPLDNGTNATDVTINGKVDDTYRTEKLDNVAKYYEVVSEIPAKAEGTMTVEQIEVTYEYRLKNYNYVVNYLEKDTDEVIASQKVGAEKQYGTEVTEYAINIEGYNKVDPTENTITIDVDNNVINFYYTKRTDLEYVVNYLEKDETPDDDTDNVVLSASKHETGRKYQEEITERAINIEGYQAIDPTEATITIDVDNNEITFYYEKRTDISYTVNYLEKDTNEVLSEAKVVENQTYQTLVRETAINIEGYTKVEPVEKTLVLDVDNNIINFYYTKRIDLEYVVNYLEKDETPDDNSDNLVLAVQKHETGRTYQEEITERAVDVEGYQVINPAEQTITIDVSNNVITFYYEKRTDISYTVNYLEKGTNEVLHAARTVENKRYQEVITSENEKRDIAGYNYDSCDPTELTLGANSNENIINIYYIKRTDLSYTVNYLEKDTNEILHEVKTVGNKIYQEEVTEQAIDIEGYNKVDPTEQAIRIEANNNVINFYYRKRTDLSYTVNYLEKDTNEVLHEPITVNNKEYKEVITGENEKKDIVGYEYDSCDPEQITLKVNTDENIINIYYTKKTDISYTVNYLEKDTNEVLHDPKTVGNKEYQEVIISENEKMDITGYNYDSCDPIELTLDADSNENVINIYYIKRTDLEYVVNYLEKDETPADDSDNTVLATQKRVTGKTYQLEVTEQAIDIEGYNKVDPAEKTITIDVSNNVITFYYEKRKDISYTVNYLEKGTNEVLYTAKTVENKEYQEVIRSENEKKDIVGYNYDSCDPIELTLGANSNENIINIYYTKRTDLSYTVNYLEKDTNEVLHAPKTVNNKIYQEEVTEQAIDIEGYNKVNPTEESITIDVDNNEITFYYEKRTDLTYVVRYLEKDETPDDDSDNNVLHEPKTVGGQTYLSEATEHAINIVGYRKLDPTEKTITIDVDNNEIIFYYEESKDLSYRVNYLEKDETPDDDSDNRIIHEPKEATNQPYLLEVTEQAIDIDGYTKVDPTEKTITIDFTENEITFYYEKRTDLEYVVNYLEKDTNIALSTPKRVTGKTFEEEINSADEVISILGYNYDSVDKDKLIITTGINVINIYYTKKDTRVIVHYYEEGTTNKIAEDNIIEGKVFDNYQTEESEDIPSKYELAEIVGSSTGQMTEDEIVVIYYYKKKETSVVVHFYEEGTTNKLSENVTIPGRVDDTYTTTAATDVPTKYELSVEPANKNGIMTEETIDVIYYYRVRDTYLIVKYVDKTTGEEISEQERQNGKVDENYITGSKVIDNYILVGDTGNATGRLEIDPITVIFYYLQNTKVTVNYIDRDTSEKLDTETIEGLVGDEYTSVSKDFRLYRLVEKPVNETVTMTADEIVLNYYYEKIDSAGVLEKHIDIYTGAILYNEMHTGKVEDSYDIPAKTFTGYDLVEERLPANSTGLMQEAEVIEVIYYYTYKSKVTVKYIDKATGEEIAEKEEINGHEGDNYTTVSKNINDYILPELPANPTGIMTKDEIIVVYEYTHMSAGVVVKHLDVKTGAKLESEDVIVGNEGDEYTTTHKNITNYDLVTERIPANKEGRMTIEKTEVIYYYIKQTKVTVKYVDGVTGEEIATKEVIEGHEGDNYDTTEKTIPGYDIKETEGNKTGIMPKDEIEVVYKYLRPAEVVINYINAETNEKVSNSDLISGHDSDEYETEAKQVPYYELVMERNPANAKGKMKVTVSYNELGEQVIDNQIIVNYYYRKSEFNMRIEKTIDSIIVNGENRNINGTVGKVELNKNKIGSTSIQIKYKIKVINDGELAGTAKIVETIPEGTEMPKSLNGGWSIKGGTAELETEKIDSGKTKEYTVTLNWLNNANAFGTIPNIAKIDGTNNEPGYEEKRKDDNESTANLVIVVKTGLDKENYTLELGIVVLVLIGASVIIYRKIKQDD